MAPAGARPRPRLRGCHGENHACPLEARPLCPVMGAALGHADITRTRLRGYDLVWDDPDEIVEAAAPTECALFNLSDGWISCLRDSAHTMTSRRGRTHRFVIRCSSKARKRSLAGLSSRARGSTFGQSHPPFWLVTWGTVTLRMPLACRPSTQKGRCRRILISTRPPIGCSVGIRRTASQSHWCERGNSHVLFRRGREPNCRGQAHDTVLYPRRIANNI